MLGVLWAHQLEICLELPGYNKAFGKKKWVTISLYYVYRIELLVP